MKKALSLILSVIMVLAVLPLTPITSSALEDYDILTTSEWRYYYYYSDAHLELDEYIGSATHVTIPDRIGALAISGFHEGSKPFRYNTTVKSIDFALHTEKIPDGFAFNCTSLESVDIPLSIRFIGQDAFSGCTNLSGVTFPNDLKKIGIGAFGGCSSLTQIEITPKVTEIGDSAFKSCSSLETVTFNNTLGMLKSIGVYAFGYCSSLESISLPNTITSVGEGAFMFCSNLESIDFPAYISYLEPDMFLDCKSLQTFNFPSSLLEIRQNAFAGCTLLNNITLPSSVHTLEDYAFYKCSSLTSISIPGSVTNIGADAFRNCTSLQSVIIGSGVRSIGEHEGSNHTIPNGETFYGCTNLTNLVLPSTVLFVGADSFHRVPGKYIDGPETALNKIEFEYSDDKANFHYRVNVTLNDPDTSWSQTHTPYINTNITLPTRTREGYTFTGWYKAGNSNGYTGSYNVTGAVTLTAGWSANANTVSFVSSKGTVPASQTVYSGNTATEPANQLVGNDYIEGWYRNSDFSGEKYDFDSVVLGSFTLYAKWVTSPTVTVNITGAGTGNQVTFRDKTDSSVVFATATQSGTFRIPADAVMDIAAADSTTYSGSVQAEIPAASGGYYLKVTDILSNQSSYTLNYGETATVNITFSAAPIVIDNIISDNNLDTSGLWSLDDGYNNHYVAGSEITVPQGEMIPTNALLTLTLTVPDGYGCEGTIVNGTQSINVIEGETSYTFQPLGDVSLNLHFYSKQNYTTLFFRNTVSGAYFTRRFLKTETEFTVPENIYSYYRGVFNNWNTSQDGNGTAFYPNSTAAVPSTDTTYYTCWDPVYFLTFNKNGGDGSMGKLSCVSTSPYITLPECEFTRNARVFAGWNTQQDGSGVSYQPGESFLMTDDTTLYAQWNMAFSIIMYENYGDNNTVRQEVLRGESAHIRANSFTRYGYTFVGWNTKADGSGLTYCDGEYITPEKTTHLYAQWRVANQTLTLSDSATVRNFRGINGGMVFNVHEGFTLLDFKAQFENEASRIRILDRNGNALTSHFDCIGNGYTVQLIDRTDSSVINDELGVAVFGDVNSDSAIDAFDMFMVNKAVNNIISLDVTEELAVDFDFDGVISISDYSAIKSAVSGDAPIDQNVYGCNL